MKMGHIFLNRRGFLRELIAILLFGCLLVTGSVVKADNLDTQRTLFKKLYAQALAGEATKVKKQRKPLQGYVVEHYLDYALLVSSMSKLPLSEIAEFKNNHPNSPLNRRLSSQLQAEIAGQKKWDLYLKHGSTLSTGVRQCWYLTALLKTRQTEHLAPLVESAWLTGLSAPDACNEVFGWWQQQGYQTDTLLLKRIDLSFKSRQLPLTRYLSEQLSHKPTWVDYAVKLLAEPIAALKAAKDWPSNSKLTEILYLAALHSAQKQPAELNKVWMELRQKHSFSLQQQHHIERQMALFAATDYEPFSITAMEQLPESSKDDQIHAWIVRYYLYHEDWPATVNAIKQMPLRQKMADRWQYWLARSLAKTDETEQARDLFRGLAKKNNYYGFLAADHLKLPYYLCQKPTAAGTANFIPPMAIQRAVELYHAGLLSMARSEWNLAYSGLSKDDKRALAVQMQEQGWYAQVITTMADLGHWEDYQARYPFAHQQSIEEFSQESPVKPAWVMAVIKQESAWAKDALSSARAHGLMQLLPETAGRIGKELGLQCCTSQELYTAPLNLQLGIQYQKNLYKQFNHPLLVAAAYNAGEGKSKDWSVDFPKAPDVWLETIPYRETRGYVTRILSNVVIYDWLQTQQPRRISHWMPTLPINGEVSQPWPNKTTPMERVESICAP